MIIDSKNLRGGWEFVVGVNDSKFIVRLDQDYWQKLTDRKKTPDDLIIDSFKFLLARESRKSILKKFNLKVISHYFPEYESELTRGK